MNNFNLKNYKEKNRINERVWMTDSIQKLQTDLNIMLSDAIINPNEKLGAHKYALKKLRELPD